MKALVTAIPLVLLAAASAASAQAERPGRLRRHEHRHHLPHAGADFPDHPAAERHGPHRPAQRELHHRSHRRVRPQRPLAPAGAGVSADGGQRRRGGAARRLDLALRPLGGAALPLLGVPRRPRRHGRVCPRAPGGDLRGRLRAPGRREPRELRPAAPAAERVAADRRSDDHRHGRLSRRHRVSPRRARPVAGAGGGVRRRGPRLRSPGHSRLRRARGGRLPRLGASGAAALRDLVRQRRPGAAEPRGRDPRLRPGEAGRRGPRRVERRPRKGGRRGRDRGREGGLLHGALPGARAHGPHLRGRTLLQRLGRPGARRRRRAVLDRRLGLGHLPRAAPAERPPQPRGAGREAHVVRPRLRAVGLDADLPHRLRRRALHERPARGRGVRGRVAQGHPGLRPRARLRLHEEDHPRGEPHPLVSRQGDRAGPLLLGEGLLPGARAPASRRP